MISGWIKLNWFAQIHLILKAEFGDDPSPQILIKSQIEIPTVSVLFGKSKRTN